MTEICILFHSARYIIENQYDNPPVATGKRSILTNPLEVHEPTVHHCTDIFFPYWNILRVAALPVWTAHWYCRRIRISQNLGVPGTVDRLVTDGTIEYWFEPHPVRQSDYKPCSAFVCFDWA